MLRSRMWSLDHEQAARSEREHGHSRDDARERAFDTPVGRTNGASLIVFRPILRQFGDSPRLHQARLIAGPAFVRPRLPAAWAVTDPVVGDRPQQRVDQPPAILWPRRLYLRGECRDG